MYLIHVYYHLYLLKQHQSLNKFEKNLLVIYWFRKSPIRQSYLFGNNTKQRGDGEGNNMNMSTSPTSPLLPSSPSPAVLSTTTADTNELMKKIDYFIKVKINSFKWK